MAHHASTPQSVIDAPKRTTVAVSTQPGQNRHGRRHVLLGPDGAPLNITRTITIPKAARQPATNTTHVKA